MTDTTASPPPVRHRRDARGVHWLTLDQPKAFNVLSEAALGELQRRAQSWKRRQLAHSL